MNANPKLSALLRAGIKMTRPLRGQLIKRTRKGTYAACALGAIAIARYGVEGVQNMDDYRAGDQCIDRLIDEYPILHQVDDGGYTLVGQIILRNDHEKQTRMSIVKWLQKQGL